MLPLSAASEIPRGESCAWRTRVARAPRCLTSTIVALLAVVLVVVALTRTAILIGVVPLRLVLTTAGAIALSFLTLSFTHDELLGGCGLRARTNVPASARRPQG